MVNVDYRLAPEYPWPIPVNDAYAAVKWVRLSFLRFESSILGLYD